MSLKKVQAGLALVIFLVYLNDCCCGVLDRTGQLAIATSHLPPNISANRSAIVKNSNGLDDRPSRETGIVEFKKNPSINLVEESRKKKKNQNQKGFMQRILPMMIIPFVVSTSIIPIILISLKLLILKSAFIGKIGILLMLLNIFRRRTNGEGGVFNHNIAANDVAMEHYGYHGDEEYGAYVSQRKKRTTDLF